MDWEMKHAKEAEESGIYITFHNEVKNRLCGRVGSESRCFCGHYFPDHNKILTKKKFDSKCKKCKCQGFKWIPTRPEEIGFGHLPRRSEFNIHKFFVKCKCGHAPWSHDPKSMKCNECNKCYMFHSDFACLGCDSFWEDHSTIYELEHERYMQKKPIGKEFYPLA